MNQLSPYLDTAPETQSAVHASAKPLPRPSCLGLQLARGGGAMGILDQVAERFGITRHEIYSKGPGARVAHLANARHVAAWLLRQTGMSYPGIGKMLGGRDHTTIMSAVAKIDRERAESETVRVMLDEIMVAPVVKRSLDRRAEEFAEQIDAMAREAESA